MSTILKWAGNKTAIMSELKKHLPAGPRLVGNGANLLI